MPFLLYADNQHFSLLLTEAEQLRTSAPDRAIEIIETLSPYQNSLEPQQKHQFLFISSYLKAFKGHITESLILSEPLINSPFPDTRTKVHLLLANIFEATKNYEKAYNHLYTAMTSVSAINEQILRSSVYTVATQLHISAGAYEKAIEFSEMIPNFPVTTRELCISEVLKLHATIRLHNHYSSENASKAMHNCLKANELLMAHTLDIFTAEADIVSQPAKVKDSMQRILPELENIGFPFAILRARYFLAFAQLKLGELTTAKLRLEQVLQQATTLRDNRTANETLLLLAQLYEKTGDATTALNAYKEHITALNAYINEYKERSVAYHMAQANFMENENRMALLRSQNDLLQLEGELQRADKRRTIMIAIILVLTLLTVIYLLNTKRSQLNRLATTDFLTRLFNRRYFSETVSRQLDNRRQQEHYSLIVFDIDLFKTINDKYGHATGDQVLATIADRCRQHIRQQDILARIGGEEFALFLPGCHLDAAYSIAEQCRLSIENTPIVIEEQMIKVTASFGVASSKTADFDTLLKHADTALYQAKAGGRNCSRIFNSHG